MQCSPLTEISSLREGDIQIDNIKALENVVEDEPHFFAKVVDDHLRRSYGGKGGRGGSMTGRGGGWLAKRLMVLNEGCGGGGLVVRGGCDGAGGGEDRRSSFGGVQEMTWRDSRRSEWEGKIETVAGTTIENARPDKFEISIPDARGTTMKQDII
ncbi:hypothetical protein Tco_1378136 [Tanacetum coccineum]